MSTTNGLLRCDMRRDCTNPVTHIGAKGYAYCASCAPERRGVEACRKMTRAEIATITAGGQISYRREPSRADGAMADGSRSTAATANGRDLERHENRTRPTR